MTRDFRGRTFLALAAVMVAAGVGAAVFLSSRDHPPASTAASSATGTAHPNLTSAAVAKCRKQVIEDWYADGRVGRIYPLVCYSAALNSLPYDDASPTREGIQNALERARQGKLASGPSRAWTAQRAAEQTYSQWSAALRAGVAAQPTRVFPNPPFRLLRQRLQRAAHRFGFRIERLYIMWPRQQAPFIIVSTANSKALAHDTAAILKSLDPKRNTGDDRTGWAYEGFYFQALDSTRQPFLIVFNFWRGPNAGGGQWAADKSLVPYAHG